MSQTQKNHSRCRDIFKILKKLNCRAIATQVPVNLGSTYRIKTQLDGVGVLPRGEIVVLEIKVGNVLFFFVNHNINIFVVCRPANTL